MRIYKEEELNRERTTQGEDYKEKKIRKKIKNIGHIYIKRTQTKRKYISRRNYLLFKKRNIKTKSFVEKKVQIERSLYKKKYIER